MTSDAFDPFVTPEWLAERLGRPGIVPVEASFYLPDEGKDAGALFAEAHIPGATRFDIDAVADHASELPHMLPDPATFGAAVGALGIATDDTIVIYDATDLIGGARAWWMFRHYGARDVRLLKGGFKAWQASGLPVERGPGGREPAVFAAASGSGRVVEAEQVQAASRSGAVQIVDARSASRFAGTVPEPRPGLRPGHIPNARNLPWRDLVDAEGNLRSNEEVAAAFQKAGVDVEQPIIASCGSGVSAALLLLGLTRLGHGDGALYDGSWAEWGGRADLPLETGAARG